MKKNLVIILVFIIVTLILTYPLVFRINTLLPGFFSTNEPFGVLWGSWAVKYLFLNHLPINNFPFTAYPFGTEIHPLTYKSYLWVFWYNSLSIATNPAFTYNFQILLNFFLSAVFTYLLAFFVTKSRPASFFAAISFAFCPYQFMRAWQHLGLTYNELLPLSLFSLILLREGLSGRRKLFFLIGILLLYSFNYCIAYLGSVMLSGLLAYALFYELKLRQLKLRSPFPGILKYFKTAVFLWVIALLILAVQIVPTFVSISKMPRVSASAFNFSHRPFEDLFVQSARPLSYFLPAVTHPLFGKFTEQFIGSPYYGISFTEHTLYVGWVTIILSLVGYAGWRKRRKILFSKTNSDYQILDSKPQIKEDFFIGFFLFLAIAGWLFSQPPWWRWGPVRIYMPSFFIYKLLPMFRAYCRFGIVVMLALSVLGGFGLKAILDKLKSKRSKIAVASLLCGLVIFEFWNYPPFRVIDLTRYPRVYDWLGSMPGKIVIAEYPLDTEGPNEIYKFYQTKHQKAMINATIPGTYANRATHALKDISLEKTAAGLRWLGVDLVLVHTDSYLANENLEEEKAYEKIAQNKGLQFVKKVDEVEVYKVVAQAAKPLD